MEIAWALHRMGPLNLTIHLMPDHIHRIDPGQRVHDPVTQKVGARFMTLVLVVPGRPLSANDRGHWRTKARAVARVRREAFELAVEQWGNASEARRRRITRWPADVTVVDHCRTANLRDTANAAPSVKAIIDGVMDYGLFPDDGPRWVGAIIFMPAVKTGFDELNSATAQNGHGVV